MNFIRKIGILCLSAFAFNACQESSSHQAENTSSPEKNPQAETAHTPNTSTTDSTPKVLDTQAHQKLLPTKTYEGGAFFTVAYPSSFKVKPSMKNSDGKTYDSAEFESPDGKVAFYVFSPQWGGEASDIAFNPAKEKKGAVEKKGLTTWYTYEAKDGSYARSYQDNTNEEGNVHWVLGIKYANQAALSQYKADYEAFKKSLQQFAD